MALHSRGFMQLAFAFTLAASLAQAQQAEEPARAKARELGYAGVHAYQAGDYAKANQQLARAYEVLPVPSLGLWSARALVKLGQLVQGAELYLQVTKLQVSGGNAAIQRQAQLDAETELGLLVRRIPRVRFRVQGAPVLDVALRIDQVPLSSERVVESQPFNPGLHRVVAAYGERRVELGFEAVEGRQSEVLLDFSAGAPKPSQAVPEQLSAAWQRRRTLAWVGLGLGGAGVAVGTVAGLIALGKKGSLDDSENCWEDHCTPSERERVDSYNSLRHVSTIGFVAGGVFAAAGVVLWVSANRSEKQVGASRAASRALELSVAPSGALLRGRF